VYLQDAVYFPLVVTGKHFRRSRKALLLPGLSALPVWPDTVTIHPFIDGNDRTGRFLMNPMLATGGYP